MTATETSAWHDYVQILGNFASPDVHPFLHVQRDKQ